MLKIFAGGFFAVLLSSTCAFASAGDLIGSWLGPCNQDGREYTRTLSVLSADGVIMTGNYVYQDSNCAGPVVRKDRPDPGTFVATDSSLEVKMQVQKKYLMVLTADYKIQGDVVSLVPTKLTINGQEFKAPEPTQLTRVP